MSGLQIGLNKFSSQLQSLLQLSTALIIVMLPVSFLKDKIIKIYNSTYKTECIMLVTNKTRIKSQINDVPDVRGGNSGNGKIVTSYHKTNYKSCH